MTPHPLSARLLTQADDLRQLAHMASGLNAELAQALVLNAARLGLASVAAQSMERDLKAARSADGSADRSATPSQTAARARIIRAILRPLEPNRPHGEGQGAA